MSDAPFDFDKTFEQLTGHSPLRWQIRLFHEFLKGPESLPKIIDLPTGLGKTMVMAIWLIARAKKLAVPTRLIYVVDRRTVVDQATDLAETLVKNWKEKNIFDGDPPAISTLRGQLADNREWSRDPSKPAIIIGTVDLIGSGLLFSGYRSSYKRRPLEAGLLGHDSLLVLDEAHLSKPFEKLITSISQFQHDQGTPMKVIRMSATTAGSDANRFHLDDSDLSDPIIDERFNAKKQLTITPTDNVIDSIATVAGDVAKSYPGPRVVIFVKSPKAVDEVRKALIKKDKTHETKIAMLTGTMRGLERDELVTPPDSDNQHERRVMQRFLKPDNNSLQGKCFLISTSAGEVGFDLNADHMICDATPLDSMIQRLGRVNRRGKSDATIHLILEKKPADKTDMDKACIAASKLFVGDMDVSPKSLAAFKSKLTPEQLEAASTPKPTMVELTDILLDAWSMTSITEPMPGRPEVAPWLRGIDDELPQTTIAWRVELDIPGFDQLDLETIEEWFDTHRVLTHETLSVPTSVAAKTLLARWSAINEQEQLRIGKSTVIVDRAGFKTLSISEFIKALQHDDRQSSKTYDSIRNADLILPASFGGIERGKGLLDADAPEVPKDEVASDVADERGRYREIITKTEDGETENRPIGTGSEPTHPSRFTVELESDDDDKRVQLVSYVPKQEKSEWGSKKQALSEHVGRVRKRLDEIMSRLDLTGPIMLAAQLAADYHDHGKNRERWQRCVEGQATPPGEKWRDETLGKSGGEMKRDPRGYRHEFGSLRDFLDAHQSKTDPNVLDLALHLIATHHGRGRPHFPKGGFDPDAESRSPEIHTDAIRRFARLQRTYSHWRLAWLENLLRCADTLASADQDPDNDTVKSSETAGGAK